MVDANDPRGRATATRRENDNLLSTARDLGLPRTTPLVFLCECGDPYCAEYVKLTVVEYDAQRKERGVILRPGHRATQGDRHRAA